MKGEVDNEASFLWTKGRLASGMGLVANFEENTYGLGIIGRGMDTTRGGHGEVQRERARFASHTLVDQEGKRFSVSDPFFKGRI